MPLTNIYALCEPGSQTPRYIGQTTFPLGHRLSNHVASAKRGKSSNGLSTWVVDMAIDTALGANKAMRPPSKGDGDA